MRTLLLAVLATVLLSGGVVLAGQPAGAAPPAAAPAVSRFTPLSPVRVLDTRDGTGGPASPVGGGQTIVLDLAAWVPGTATAVVLNVTAVSPTAATFVTVFPAGPRGLPRRM